MQSGTQECHAHAHASRPPARPASGTHLPKSPDPDLTTVLSLHLNSMPLAAVSSVKEPWLDSSCGGIGVGGG